MAVNTHQLYAIMAMTLSGTAVFRFVPRLFDAFLYASCTMIVVTVALEAITLVTGWKSP